MAADNAVHIVLINPAGNLIQRTATFNPVNGSSNLENMIKSALQVVAIFVVRDLNGDISGPFWDEWSGNNQYKISESYDGITVGVRDVPGGGGGGASVRLKAYFSDSASSAPFSVIDSKYHESTMGSGGNWVVFDDGQGNLYEQKLQEARVLVGRPGA